MGISIPMAAFGPAPLAVTLGLAVLLVLRDFIREKRYLDLAEAARAPLGLSLLLLLGWCLLGALFSSEKTFSLITLLRTALSVLLCHVIFQQLRDKQAFFNLAVKTLLVSSAIVIGYIFIVQYLYPEALEIYAQFRSSDTKVRWAFKAFSSVAACLIPIFLWFSITKQGYWRICALILLPLAIAIIWRNGINTSRSALFGLAGSIVFLALCFILQHFSKRRFYVIFTGILITVSLFSAWLLSAMPHYPFDGMALVDIALPFPDPHRQVIWARTAEIIMDHPFMGIGLNTINLLPQAQETVTLKFAPGMVKTIEFIPSHPHNWILEIAVEAGLVGLAITFACFTILIGNLLHAIRVGQNTAWVPLGLIGVFSISSMTNFSIWTSWWQAIFFVLLALCLAAVYHHQETN